MRRLCDDAVGPFELVDTDAPLTGLLAVVPRLVRCACGASIKVASCWSAVTCGTCGRSSYLKAKAA